MTMTISRLLGDAHIQCDELFAAAEAAIYRSDWPLAVEAFGRFRAALLGHLLIEEEILFPAFERSTGNTLGPTHIMRLEHERMRELIGQLAEALDARSADNYAGLAETLLLLIQQHNIKEEQVLYPLCDQVLGGEMVAELGDRSAAPG